MFIQLLRLLLGHSFNRFEFKPFYEEKSCKFSSAGLYIHVPFCTSLCDFCPYYKIEYQKELAERFVDSLLKEIDLVKKTYEIDSVISVYYGGGSPALLSDRLSEINAKIRESFPVTNMFAIELHPSNLTAQRLKHIRDAGFTMISVGVQSFNEQLLSTLGRNDTRSPQSSLEILSDFEFKTVDIDLIFGIPGQTGDILREDFLKAIELGATQISAYPFIDFSYAHNKARPMKKKIMKQLLGSLVDVAMETDFERSSVWTFKKRGSERYSSITRDLFIGMGPSATTLTLEDFYINTFSVPQYCSMIESEKRAISLNQVFTQRTRMLYWLFWSCYEMKISSEAFSALFNKPIEKVFGNWLNLGCQFKLLERTDEGYTLTQKGAYYYHLAEQALTHAYIDKTWKKCHEQAFPQGFKI